MAFFNKGQIYLNGYDERFLILKNENSICGLLPIVAEDQSSGKITRFDEYGQFSSDDKKENLICDHLDLEFIKKWKNKNFKGEYVLYVSSGIDPTLYLAKKGYVLDKAILGDLTIERQNGKDLVTWNPRF